MTAPQPAPAGIEGGPFVGGREAAKRLGVTERTVHRWSDDGLLPVAYRTKGGHRRYAVSALEAAAEAARDPEDGAA